MSGSTGEPPNVLKYHSFLDNFESKVFLWRSCWHIGCCNTLALKLAGLDVDKTDFSVPGGVVDCDADGATGILRERAVEMVVAAIGEKTDEQKQKFIVEGLRLCLRKGLSAVHTNDEMSLHVYQALMRSGALPLRVFLTPNLSDLTKAPGEGGVAGVPPFRHHGLKISAPQVRAVAEAAEGSSLNEEANIGTAESRLVVERVKIFSDGSLGAETAAIRNIEAAGDMEAQYSGVLIHSSSDLESSIRLAKTNGYRLEIHAIGDKAAEQVRSQGRKLGGKEWAGQTEGKLCTF